MCEVNEFHCGQGFCVDGNAQCNGFKDCVINYAEEVDCGMCTMYCIKITIGYFF